MLVPTPIGNLEDITLRALSVLRQADAVAAEDTRHSRKLLTHFEIDKPLLRLDAHTIAERGAAVLAQYEMLAFVTDAGTPGISDPGAELVQIALNRGDQIEVLPGPTALIPALVLSGLPLARFCFEGFLPRKGSTRRERLQAIGRREITQALFESPKRLLATLDDLIAVCGPDRPASVSREISKRFEQTYRGSVQEIRKMLTEHDLRGELVLIIGPPTKQAKDVQDFAAKAKQLAATGVTGRELRRTLMALGAPRNVAYELSLKVPQFGKDLTK